MRELLDVKGLAETARPFRARLIQIADELALDPSYIAAVISLESAGTFSPSILNMAGSGAVGLIQFMPSTAAQLGTSSSKLAAMTATQQLTYVRAYFKGIGPSRIKSPLDYYLAVFSPAFIGKDRSTPMYSAPTKQYTQNRGLDADNDGTITVGDVGTVFLGVIARAEARPRLPVDEDDAPSSRGALTGLSVAFMVVTIYTLSKLVHSAHHVAILEEVLA